MTKLELENRQGEIQKEMSELLIQIREGNGIKSAFTVSKELGQSQATLRNIEKGISFPTNRTLKDLISLYIMTPGERERVNALKTEMLKIRRALKELRGN